MAKKDEKKTLEKEIYSPIVSEGHIGFLKAEEYWQWRFSISEWRKAEAEQRFKELQQKLFDRDAELSKMKAHLFLFTEVENAKKITEAHKKDYENLKKTIEDRLQHSLNECIINDVTYEVSHPETRKTV